MTRYQVQAKRFVKGYEFFPFARNICKNISKILNSKYSKERLDHGKQSAIDAFKTFSKRVIQKTAEATVK